MDFVVFGRGTRRHVIVPVPCGAHGGESILKVARNNLRVFFGSLAAATTACALTDADRPVAQRLPTRPSAALIVVTSGSDLARGREGCPLNERGGE
ncbi:hypothetical protein [Methylobacterium sp. Gmos1]